MSGRLRIALTKGRLQDKSVELFERMGLDCTPVRDPGRRLVHAIPNYPLDAVLAKAPDVITYVEHGVCDLGVVGKDTILEKGGAFYEVLDLGFGRCRFALAVKEGTDFYGTYKTRRVASKYPAVTRAFFAEKGMDVDIIKIEGYPEGQRPGAHRDSGPGVRTADRQHRQHEAAQEPDQRFYRPL